jgi:hypothetical protein
MRILGRWRKLERLARVGVVALLLAPAGRLPGQSWERSGFDLAAGPVGSRGMGLGLHVSGAYATAASPSGLDVRFEGTLSIWPPLRGLAAGGRTRVSSLGASLVQMLSRGAVGPYATAGVGGYLRPGDDLTFGVNAGAGLRFRLGPASLFTEARVHRLLAADGQRLVPLTLGVRF